MSDLPDVEATVKLVKEILSESLDLVSEKRRFRAFLQDYSRRANIENGLLLEGKHLNVLVSGMSYPRFDEVVSRNKTSARSVGLRGLGDWLARKEGYDKALCQWVEVVWSQSLGLKGRKVSYSTGAGKSASASSKAREAGRKAGHRSAEQDAQKPLRYRESKTAPKRAVGAVFRDNLRSGGQGPEMVVLPTGRFLMGDLYGRSFDNERPVRTVTISRPIAMGKYPVTFEEYDRFVSATGAVRPEDADWGRGTRPVIDVSQEEAKAYAVWLSEQTGKRYRLPSEAEWEYAARAGTTTEYSWGNEIGRNRANCDRCGSEWDCKQTAPVGSFAANSFGLYDMHGNVWEWVADCWHDNYEGAPTDGRAWTTGGDESSAVMRGGSWVNNPHGMRSASRYRIRSSSRDRIYGFRLVRVEDDAQKPLRYRESKTAPKRAVEVFRDTLRSGGQGPEMVVLPTGRFRMGDLGGSGIDDERPVRTVTISRPIAMGKYPVTFEEYDRFVGGFLKALFGRHRPADGGWGRGTRPVINVSQEDAKAYAVWLSEQTGKRYRLPSEAEWEYAARAGTTTRYSWGDSISCSQARYGRRPDGECSDSHDGTVAVGSFAANPFGLYDMHGNVWEWVADCWHDNYEGAPSDGSAWTTGGDESLAVLRGGSWVDDPLCFSSASRCRDKRDRPSVRSVVTGFRLVQDLNP